MDLWSFSIVQHRAQPAPEERIYKLARSFPSEVAVVERVILVKEVQILGQFLRCVEIINVNEWMVGSGALIEFLWRTHDDWDDVVPVNKNHRIESCQTMETSQSSLIKRKCNRPSTCIYEQLSSHLVPLNTILDNHMFEFDAKASQASLFFYVKTAVSLSLPRVLLYPTFIIPSSSLI